MLGCRSRCKDDIQYYLGKIDARTASEDENLRTESLQTVSIWLDSLSPAEEPPSPTTFPFLLPSPHLRHPLKRNAAVEAIESSSTSRARAKRARLNPPPSPSTHVLANSSRAKLLLAKQPHSMSPQKKQPRSGSGGRVDKHSHKEEVERPARCATITRASARHGPQTGRPDQEHETLFYTVPNTPPRSDHDLASQAIASTGTIGPLAQLRVRPASPTKSSSTGRGSGKGSARLDKIERMAFLTPSVRFQPPAQIGNKEALPAGVKNILKTYFRHGEPPVIPIELKSSIQTIYDTPMKTRIVEDRSFAADLPNYHPKDHPMIMSTMEDIIAMAARYRHIDCTEAHWISVTVSPMLNLVRRLRRFKESGRQLQALDLSYVRISPSSLCTYDSDEHFKDLDKKIDYALGLHLPEEQTQQLQRGIFNIKITVPSINQTSSFINLTPVFLNVEVKIPNTDKNPLIQLGAWISAEFRKRVEEEYSLDMPVLALEVVGDKWDLYITYANVGEGSLRGEDYGVRFIGPFELGSTTTIQGAFRILDGICRCANWGTSMYRSWFESEILKKYQPLDHDIAAAEFDL